jgi:hypothetical protein
MSVFHLSPNQIHEELAELPAAHTREQIFALVERLQADIRNDPPNLSFTQRLHLHANAHKELFFSYPILFRSVCKGTYRPVVVSILLDAKEAIASGQKSKTEALEEVVKRSVDDVNRIRGRS